MTLARCPHCATTFRATPEQLAQRAGKVRCGKCRRVFNALENQVEETALPEADLAGAPATPPPAEPPSTEPLPEPPAAPAESAEWTVGEPSPAGEGVPAAPQTPQQEAAPEPEPTPEPTPATRRDAMDSGAEPAASESELPAAAAGPASLFPPEHAPSPPDALHEAQAAGIAAKRETRDVPGFKWAEGALSAPDTHFHEPKGAPWLMTIVVIVLGLMLVAQLAHQFRTEIAARWPDFRPWLEEACVSLNCTVPYPRKADQISLEASELSIDATRGNMLVLHFTLKNRAPFAQDYPAVELTLTDAQDNIVVRRTLPPAEYLPPALEGSKAFAAGGEVAARLWIDARDTGAVGYRLFVFYP